MNDYIATIRHKEGFLTPDELVEVYGKTNKILDPYSVLIGGSIEIGKDNIFYPNVVIEQRGDGVLVVGGGNVFYPGTYVFCDNGAVAIGNNNEFGAAGCTIKAITPIAQITIGNNGRYSNGASVAGRVMLGSGSQVLGPIAVQDCTLNAGEDYKAPDPDKRGAVFKGFGRALGITLQAGQVVNGAGDFSHASIQRQSFYHPKPSQ